ncbi:unnamed protein product [Amaranthus hypochondriacus]
MEKMSDNAVDLKDYNDCVDGVISRVNGVEKKIHEIEQFYSNNSKKQARSKCKNNGKARNAACIRKETAASERMQNLIHKFGGIINEITQHKWARPFLEPVDVVNLCLYDYHEVIKTPMDFSTIKKKMEAKNGSGYKHVREACADVRLVFENAMVYNDETNDVHIMARFLLNKFEQKWLKFLPNVTKEEVKREEEDAEVDTYAEMAREMSSELNAANMMLDKLREQLVQTRRKMSTEEKKQLAVALTQLSVEDLSRALDVVAQSNPSFTPNAEEVDLDVDALSETTLWRLKLFAKDALRAQSKPVTTSGCNNNNNNHENNGRNRNKKNNVDISKIKKEICDARPTRAKKGKMAAS